MRIALIIQRLNYYRLFAPIVDEALRRGWTVECWHNYGHPRRGGKGYEFPSIDASPKFMHGTPTFKVYHSDEQLQSWSSSGTVDAILSLLAPTVHFDTPDPDLPSKWVCLQYTTELFQLNGPKGMLAADLHCLYSDYWLSWMASYFRASGLVDPADDIEGKVALKARLVGFPELDQSSLIDPIEVRQRWGIPKSQPVVVLLPFPWRSNPKSFWARRIYAQPNRFVQLLSTVLTRRFHYLEHIRSGWNDVALVKAIKRFCERNEACLLVKSRLKDPIPRYTRSVADRCLYDEKLYPHTILEVLSIADLCVSFCSTAVMEAVPMGVPNLCIDFTTEHWHGAGRDPIFDTTLFSTEEGGLFQFLGASTTMTIPEAIENLPQQPLADFNLDTQAQKAYVTKFLGYDDGHSSGRVLDAIADA